MSFENKVVIVTGASAGIGAATALLFAKEGADVVIVGRSETRLNNVADQISKHGKKPLIVKADVGKTEDAKLIVIKTVEKYEKIDILINNAGIVGMAYADDEKAVDVFDSLMTTNVRSVVLLTSFAAPYLKKTKGNIVNISSAAGVNVVAAGFSSYCVTKAALNHLTKNHAIELAQFGIRVNAVSPGPVKTNFLAAGGIESAISEKEAANKYTALKRLSEPEEIADVIMFLASDKAKSVTGSNYSIDCGHL